MKRQKTDDAESFWAGEDSSTSDTAAVGAQVSVRLPPPTHFEGRRTLPEWTVVELQGSLEGTRSAVVASSESMVEIGGKTIGKLSMASVRGGAKPTPLLSIGSHYLDGRVVPLNPPILITKLLTVVHDEENSAEYEILGVARQKILFKNRPRFNLG